MNVNRIAAHVAGEGQVEAPCLPETNDFMRILKRLIKKTQGAEQAARQCMKELYGKPELASVYSDADSKLWQEHCAAPEFILALQTTLVVTRQECQEKVKHVNQEKEEALVKCSREWKRAIRTAAKKMNKEQAAGQPQQPCSAIDGNVLP